MQGLVIQHEVPERTLVQRRDALKTANRVRTSRAQWKRDVKIGRADALVPLLAAADECETVYDTMKVFDFLLALPKVGRVKANKWLTQTRISPSKTLGGMTSRQRAELLSTMGGRLRS